MTRKQNNTTHKTHVKIHEHKQEHTKTENNWDKQGKQVDGTHRKTHTHKLKHIQLLLLRISLP